jgi:hypothetical protein
MPKKVKAARLVLGGAPETWHAVVGLPGHFHPTIAVPHGHAGLITSEILDAFLAAHAEKITAAAAGWETFREQRIADGKGDIGEFQTPAAPVEIVDLDERLADEHAHAAREQRAASARATAAARRAGDGDAPNVNAETQALTGAEETQTHG